MSEAAVNERDRDSKNLLRYVSGFGYAPYTTEHIWSSFDDFAPILGRKINRSFESPLAEYCCFGGIRRASAYCYQHRQSSKLQAEYTYLFSSAPFNGCRLQTHNAITQMLTSRKSKLIEIGDLETSQPPHCLSEE